jgi:hypothetical protein
MKRPQRLLALLPCFLPMLTAACSPSTHGWQQVGGPLRNVSGMALVGQGADEVGPTRVEFLVVHDNKAPDEPHVGAVVFSYENGVQYRRLAWPRRVEPPVDLEAICPLPGTPGSYLALTSRGRLLHLRYGGSRSDEPLEVLHESTLPGLEKNPNLEGFAVQSLGGRSVAIWAERGDGDKPGTLYWGTYDDVADAVTLRGQADVAVPYPSGRNTRHVTDLRLDGAGTVWAASASDPGDNGPFESAVYAVGTIQVRGDAVEFRQNPELTRLWSFPRKVEALEFQPGADGRVYFGADDESAGGWLYVGQPRQSKATPDRRGRR